MVHDVEVYDGVIVDVFECLLCAVMRGRLDGYTLNPPGDAGEVNEIIVCDDGTKRMFSGIFLPPADTERRLD